ncbi:hypothetical protein ACVRZR_00490 [Streptococcus entericus]|uniref:hypothetical protein n=1 Tax=Streptococcus entericus TaxID=155680 RepID=UPI000370EEEE|nr:hypothetical protein [Streptococcus entericus]
MVERIRLFLDRHPWINFLLNFVVTIGVGSLFYFLIATANSSLNLFLWLEAVVAILWIWFNMIRPSKKEREREWVVLFDILRWLTGLNLLFWAVIGIKVKGKVLSPALWQMPREEALLIIILGVALSVCWQLLYYFAKRYRWEEPTSLQSDTSEAYPQSVAVSESSSKKKTKRKKK